MSLGCDPHSAYRRVFSQKLLTSMSPGCLKLLLCAVAIAGLAGLLPLSLGLVCLAVILVLSSEGKW